MFCSKCGATLPDEAEFCFKCGNRINNVIAESKVSDDNEVHTAPTDKSVNTVLPAETTIDNYQSTSEEQKEFQNYMDLYISERTKCHSAKEFLEKKTILGIIRIIILIALGISVVWGTISVVLTISNSAPLQLIPFLVLLGIGALWILLYFVTSVKMELRPSKFEGNFEKQIDTDHLIAFLNKELAYLQPYFNGWHYALRSKSSITKGFVVNTMSGGIANGVIGAAIAAESKKNEIFKAVKIMSLFGTKKLPYVCIDIRLQKANEDCDTWVYYPYVCGFTEGSRFNYYDHWYKAVRILQAAMEYYLKKYHHVED